MRRKHLKQIPFNKVSSYQERNKDKGNATLPLEYNGVKTLAILDTGAGIGIATRAMWKKWGKRALQKNSHGPAARRWKFRTTTGIAGKRRDEVLWYQI